MKKLLLLLASMAIVASCSKPKPDPTPGPTPGPNPDAVYSINRTEATISTLDTLHVFIQNALPAQYEWKVSNANILFPVNKEMTAFQALAFGEVTLMTTIGEQTFTCKIIVNKRAELMPYDMPNVTWGAMVDDVKAEAAKTGTFLEESSDPGVYICSYELTDPTAPKGQLVEYVFKDDKLFQSFILAKYATRDQVDMAWVYTLERCVYQGKDDKEYDCGVNSAVDPTIFYSFTRGEEKATKFPVFVCYMLEPNEQAQSAAIDPINMTIKSHLSEKYNLVEAYSLPYRSLARY